MPSAMRFRIKDESGNYVKDLKAAGLKVDVTSNNKAGYVDNDVPNLSDDKTRYKVYYFVPSNRGRSPYKLRVTVALKRQNTVLATCVFEHDITK